MSNGIITAKYVSTTGNGTKVSSAISDVEYASWIRQGRVCVAKFKFTTTSEITNSTETLLSGFPAPSNAPVILTAWSATSKTGGNLRLRIQSTGTLTNGYTPGNIPAGQWEGSMTYITEP